ncbi:hypothetical protein RXV95_03140 [Novosphingobium sp. ZN18A2]|uniref:hypothetical protein n=1 Tax=Novosphingobium sp. ZN18A2 TaxID=3079861 RepID=UPI0030D33F1B
MLLRPALDSGACMFVTTMEGLPERAALRNFAIVSDCNADKPLRALLCAVQLAAIIVRFRPQRVVTTGAMPGLIAIVLARLAGARTMWIDSVANAERLSAAGSHARRFAHVHLSQWPDVASASGSRYEGRIL